MKILTSPDGPTYPSPTLLPHVHWLGIKLLTDYQLRTPSLQNSIAQGKVRVYKLLHELPQWKMSRRWIWVNAIATGLIYKEERSEEVKMIDAILSVTSPTSSTGAEIMLIMDRGDEKSGINYRWII